MKCPFDAKTVLSWLQIPPQVIADAQQVGYDLEQLLSDLVSANLAYVEAKIQLLLNNLRAPPAKK